MAQKALRKSIGEGSIYYDSKLQTWRAEIQWVDHNGLSHRKSWKGKKQTTIKNKMNDFKKQLHFSNGNFNPNEVTFEEFATHWMENTELVRLKPDSYCRKESTFRIHVFPAIGNIPINKITHKDIQMMVSQLTTSKLSYSSIKKALDGVSSCMKYYRI